MKASYPELESGFSRIAQIVSAEEEVFRRTLAGGTTILDVAVRDAKAKGATTLAGAQAFALHDTYGFPIDLTLEMASEHGLTVDESEFRRLMSEQRRRAKADAAAKKTGPAGATGYRTVADCLGHAVEFTGYDEVVSQARVAGLLLGGEVLESAPEGTEVEVVLNRTPFYAEGGGQLADAGRIELEGAIIEVDDVQLPITGLVVHRARVLEGEVRLGAIAQASVDVERRKAISRSHTATHMVHKAIREVLGETATQAGSENAPGRFRFDFQATSVIPPSALRDIESRVNILLAEDLEIHAEIMSQEQARAAGAMALFGEKYGDQVRVISVGDWARELCAGTHALRSGQLGMVKLLGEGSIGSGVRRVEALVGADAYAFAAREHVLVTQLTDVLKVRPEKLPDRVAVLVTQLRDAQKEIEKFRAAQVLAVAETLARTPKDVFGVAFVAHNAGEAGADDLRSLALDVRGRFGTERPIVVTVGGIAKGRPLVVVTTNDEARRWGVAAGDLVREAAKILGGGGGGKADVAQGGGTDPDKLADALRQVEYSVGERVTASH
jgi:alanyl-tRNA synthetase